MLGAHFSRYRAANPGRLHFAAHSHHPWPDATESAQARYWTDSAELADRKWERIFGEVLPAAQQHVARITGLSDARQVAFAPNTHEFVVRLYSCFEAQRPLRVLSSGAEFHSFARQTRRLAEAGRVDWTQIAAEPFDTFEVRFRAALGAGGWDLVWLSHVFFDSGYVVQDLESICDLAPGDAMVVVDGYHAFCALPVDLRSVHRRAFYLAGGYKYAMAGEGACFLAIPPGTRLRPVDTGWYASFETLSAGADARVPYSDGALRFWGATFDASGLYRFNAAMDWLQSTGVTIAEVHRHAVALQKHFLDACRRKGLDAFSPANLRPPLECPRGNFLAFELDGAEDLHRRITAANVSIDRRGERLRFGFGVYQDEAQVQQLVDTLARVTMAP
jgi:selenocysteine lyase/cysteine desulfurase